MCEHVEIMFKRLIIMVCDLWYFVDVKMMFVEMFKHQVRPTLTSINVSKVPNQFPQKIESKHIQRSH